MFLELNVYSSFDRSDCAVQARRPCMGTRDSSSVWISSVAVISKILSMSNYACATRTTRTYVRI